MRLPTQPPKRHTGPTPNLTAPWLPKSELASMEGVKRAFMVFQQGGVIMDVVNADQVGLPNESILKKMYRFNGSFFSQKRPEWRSGQARCP